MRMNPRVFSRLAGLLAATIVLCGATAFAQTTTQSLQKPLKELGDNPPIRVLVIDSVTSMCLTPKSPSWQIKTLAGKPVGELKSDQPTTIALVNGELKLLGPQGSKDVQGSLGSDAIALEATQKDAVLGIAKVPFGVGWWWESAEDRLYQGRIEIHPSAIGKLVVVVVLPLEQYLRGVVPSEIGTDSPLQALCAQAVAARSAAVLALTTPIYSGTYHDICSDVACQAFSGVSKCNAVTDQAVTATRGMILAFEGAPVSAYYASNCGGFTEDIRNVWPDRASDRAYWNTAVFDGPGTCTLDLTKDEDLRKWLESDPQCYCNPSKYKIPVWAKKNFRWTVEITADQLTSRVALKKDVGRVLAVRAVKRAPSGRLIEAEFVGEKGSYKVGPELSIRQVFDPPLKSAAFVVDTVGSAEKPEKFVIRGAGWGHGVGMCQTGAVAMANAGKAFAEILAHYYPNAKVEKLY